MDHPEAREHLHDYIDGTLSRDRRAALDEHLAACAACREELADLRDLLHAARALPREIQPPRDLWPGVAARMRRRSLWKILRLQRPIMISGAAVAATAILIFILALPDRSATVPSEDPYFAAMVQALEAECRGADIELATHACPEVDPLNAAALATIEENLATLERAIAETRAVWAADAGGALWGQRLADQYRHKLALQEQALRLSMHT